MNIKNNMIIRSLSFVFSSMKRKLCNSHNGDFEPLDIRRGNTLTSNEYMYAFKLHRRHVWLAKYSNQLEFTIRTLLTEKQCRNLFSKMLKEFVYVDRDTCHQKVLRVVHQIENVWKCDKNTTVIIAAKKVENGHPDGSNVFLYNLQSELKTWKTNRFISSFNLKNKRVNNSENIIICDDFIGSGETIEKRIDDLYAEFKGKKRIYIVSLGAMDISKKRISKYDNIAVFSSIWLSRILNHDQDSQERNTMLGMENLLASKYKEYELNTMSLGYKESGALYYNEEYRIPNNVYPIFWWGKLSGGEDFDSIFLRS